MMKRNFKKNDEGYPLKIGFTYPMRCSKWTIIYTGDTKNYLFFNNDQIEFLFFKHNASYFKCVTDFYNVIDKIKCPYVADDKNVFIVNSIDQNEDDDHYKVIIDKLKHTFKEIKDLKIINEFTFVYSYIHELPDYNTDQTSKKLLNLFASPNDEFNNGVNYLLIQNKNQSYSLKAKDELKKIERNWSELISKERKRKFDERGYN